MDDDAAVLATRGRRRYCSIYRWLKIKEIFIVAAAVAISARDAA